jgi:hypothetical protein
MKHLTISIRQAYYGGMKNDMAKMLARCPVCDGGLKISELSCERCNTRIQSVFDPCRFCSLAPEHLTFIELFLRCEGNLSRVEKELGVSYPTVRNRLTGALTALGLTGESPVSQDEMPSLPAESEDSAVRRRDALNALARGEMSAEDAARILRELS